MEEKTLVQKLVEISQEIGFLEFDGTNDHHDYGYAKASTVIRKVNLALGKRGVLMTVNREDVHFYPESGVATSAMVLCFADEAQQILSCGSGQGKDKGDKAVMKASTAAYKNAIAHAFTLAWGAVDPEGDSSTDREERPAAKKTIRKPKAAKAEEPAADAGPPDIEALKGMIAGMTDATKKDISGKIIAGKSQLPEIVYDSLTKAWQAKRDELRKAAGRV